MSEPAPDFSEPPPVSNLEAAGLFAGLAGETRLLVGVSGGPDSVALLALLADWVRGAGRPALHAATVDHGLRAASAAEARDVAALCERLGVSHEILIWDGVKPATGLQAQARRARYELLAAAATRLGGAVLMTAHTLDDQAETLLMRMAHGSGPSGLVGMRDRVRKGEVELVRPLLGVSKARLVATARARHLPFIHDPSNGDSRFERVRWRKLLPELADEGLSAERLAALARRMARMEQAVAHRAAELLPILSMPVDAGQGVRLRFSALLAEPEEIVLRVVAFLLDEVAAEREGFGRLERLESCVLALAEASRHNLAMNRTLSGCLLSLGLDGVLTLRREAVRRRGVHPATS
ncbi:tRNA lysidine(34) synthetase TilS [Bosea lathyri]|uniref:tRNA(Ile)-lysidine synthase n=1 Tax=Bosea lathyri TaxID=1036778 RepID=A0A1H6B2I6_9HYPH|nr:tRNA lysidine(34) synthetase TilS [Bosea lathyri]SEG54555.1 tRNA(Ile)-lysidine synthase [Bosea lathyri]